MLPKEGNLIDLFFVISSFTGGIRNGRCCCCCCWDDKKSAWAGLFVEIEFSRLCNTNDWLEIDEEMESDLES